MERVVCYSLALLSHDPRPDIVWQFGLSVASLRAYSPGFPLVLFVHGELTNDVAAICRQHRVSVHMQGPYEHRLASLCPAGWRSLARYPLLHKFLNFEAIAATDARAVLVCDCDTVFGASVERLFDRYDVADIVAREEVHSSRSPHGADRAFIDEHLLAMLAAADGGRAIPPFNLGVVLFNHRVWQRFGGLDALFVDYAWRFVSWMATHPAVGAAAALGEFRGIAEARQTMSVTDAARMLPYPSTNRWILDEISLWMSLGHLPGLTLADFARSDVCQNGEFFDYLDSSSMSWTVCHYYSQNTTRIADWLVSGRLQPASP